MKQSEFEKCAFEPAGKENNLLRDGSIDEKEKNLLQREAERLSRLGLQHDEILEQLIMINRTFFIQPLSNSEVLSICAKVS